MTPNIATAIVVGKTLVSLVVSFQSKKGDRKEKVVVKLRLHFKFLSISFSVSVGNGKLIPSEKKNKRKNLRMTGLIRGYVNKPIDSLVHYRLII